MSWIFPVDLEEHAITNSSAAKYAIYVFFVDREIRGVAPLAILHQTLKIFGSNLEDDAILASAKSIIYRYFVQVGLTTRSSPGKEGSLAGAHPPHDNQYFSFISIFNR
ncbi:hypothetical protein LAZ67_17002514 [Cordylochernes scorpioides]|uniref:Uncharacterized protein n=1 Tax=Cordylochernes scorpioides TaxID=51811 RepID=A0ABY6LGV3_9ARAC|nr:hypothetical protein LAZ67_17002514 [Cordylochernes scorpioides]